MKIRNYVLNGILEQCKERGLKTIDDILDELKEFNDMHIVVETIKKDEIIKHSEQKIEEYYDRCMTQRYISRKD